MDLMSLPEATSQKQTAAPRTPPARVCPSGENSIVLGLFTQSSVSHVMSGVPVFTSQSLIVLQFNALASMPSTAESAIDSTLDSSVMVLSSFPVCGFHKPILSFPGPVLLPRRVPSGKNATVETLLVCAAKLEICIPVLQIP